MLPAPRGQSNPLNKFCRKCKTWRERSEFKSDKNRTDGKYPWCISCVNTPNVHFIAVRTKFCNACQTSHDIDEFSFDKRVKDGRQASCRRSRDQYYQINRDAMLAVAKVNHKKSYCTIEGRVNHMWRASKTRAKARNIDFNISKLQVVIALHVGTCQKSGIRFDLSKSSDQHRNAFAPSIDRIDNAKGYTFDNVQFVCNMFNSGKSEHDEIDFITMCCAVADRFKDDPRVLTRLIELRS